MKYNTVRSITIPFTPFIIFHQFEYSAKDMRITIQEEKKKCVKHSNMVNQCKQMRPCCTSYTV